MSRILAQVIVLSLLIVSCQEEQSNLESKTMVGSSKLIDTTIVATETLHFSFGYFGDEEGVSVLSPAKNSLVCELLNKQWEERVLSYIPKNDFLGVDSVIVVSMRGSDGAGPSTNVDTTTIVIRVVKDNFHKKLIGKWNWISSCGGFTGGCWYPGQNFHEQIEFDNQMRFTEKFNDSIVRVLPYQIIGSFGNEPALTYQIGFGNETDHHVYYRNYYRFDGDNLNIQGGDFWKEYERIK